MSITRDRTVMRLDSERAGDGSAMLHVDGSGELGGAFPIPSVDERIANHRSIDQLEPNFEAAWYAVAEGACW